MVALLGFLEVVQVLLEVILLEEGRGVDALQHLPLHIAAPVGPGGGEQLEVLEVRRIRHVRAAAQIDERAIGVGADDFVATLEIIEALELERIVGEPYARLAERHFFAHERILLGHDLLHLGFERRQIIGRERLLDFEVVVEAVLDGRTEADLGIGAQAAHCGREDVGPGVPQHLNGTRVLFRDDHEGTRCP